MRPLHTLVLGILSLSAGDACAQTSDYFNLGSLDEWGTGSFTTAIGTNDDVIRAAKLLSDGRIVAAGRSHNGNYDDFLIIRLHPDGSFDNSFDSDGIVVTNHGTGDALAHALDVDGNGRIVVAGRRWGFSDFDFGVSRYNSDGSLDTTFGVGGMSLFDLGGNDFARDVAIDSADRIVVAGYTDTSSNWDFAVARLTSNGLIDNTFDTDGYQITDFSSGSDQISSIQIDSNNRIIAVGHATVAGFTDAAIAVYQTNGSLDGAFSGDGRDTWSVGQNDGAWDVALDETQGRYYLGGRAGIGMNYDAALFVYLTSGTQQQSATITYGTNFDVVRSIILDGNDIYMGGHADPSGNSDFAISRGAVSELALDPDFDTDGVVSTDISNDDFAYALAVQTDDKVVVAGFARGTTDDFAVARYLSDGSLDTSFNTTGTRTSDISGGSDDVAKAVAMHVGGRIILAGYSLQGADNDFALIRYNSNGSVDSTFDSDGTVITAISTNHDAINAIAITSDNKIIVAGHSDNGSNFDFALARYHTNGALDTSFSSNGIATTAIGTENSATSINLDNSGRIVVVGNSESGGVKRLVVARYLSSGSLDTSFNTTGISITTYGSSSDDTPFSVVIQSDNKIIVGGQVQNGTDYGFAVSRFGTNGSLDGTFDSDGKVVTDVNATAGAQLFAITQDAFGRIIGVGRTNHVDTRVAMVRYLTSGALDTSFDTDGIFEASIGTGSDGAYAIGTDSQSRVVVAGYVLGTEYDFAVARFKAGISLDNSFDTDGKVTTAISGNADNAFAMLNRFGVTMLLGRSNNGTNFDLAFTRYAHNGALAAAGALDPHLDSDGIVTNAIGANDEIAYSVAVTSDAKAVIAGFSNNGARNEFAISRYLIDGTLDTSFDTDGIALTNINTDDAVANAVAIQSDGKIIAAGYVDTGSNHDFAIARYNTNGSPDTTFSGDGSVFSAIGAGDDNGNDLAIDGNGLPVVVGSMATGSAKHIAVARYTTAGVLDNNFSGDGIATAFHTAGSDDTAYAVAILSDNRIVVGGQSQNLSAMDFSLARFLTNGNLDTSFDSDGLVTTDIETTAGAQLFDIALQSDEKIVAVGRTLAVNQAVAIARYNTDGSLDTSFSTDGILLSSLTAESDIGYGVAITGNNKIVVTGQGDGAYDFVIARYLSSGSLDTSFSSDGIFSTGIGTADDVAYGIAVDPIGRLVVTGGTFNGTNWDMATIRVFP